MAHTPAPKPDGTPNLPAPKVEPRTDEEKCVISPLEIKCCCDCHHHHPNQAVIIHDIPPTAGTNVNNAAAVTLNAWRAAGYYVHSIGLTVGSGAAGGATLVFMVDWD